MSEASNDKLEQRIGSKFALVIAVAKRAKQLKEGSPKLVDSKSRNPITIALEEIAAGVVTATVPTQEQMEALEKRESVPKSQARETAELLRVTEQEEDLVGVSEVPDETVPSGGPEIGAIGMTEHEAEPELEESEEDADEEAEEEDADEVEASPAEAVEGNTEETAGEEAPAEVAEKPKRTRKKATE